jgi:hypothetical protein
MRASIALRRRSAIATLVSVFAVSSCSSLPRLTPVTEEAWREHSTWRWSYAPARASDVEPLVDGELVVADLVDLRPSGKVPRTRWAMVPFVLSAEEIVHRPFEPYAGPGDPPFTATVDIADALAGEIDAARVFRGVRREPAPAVRFALTGELLSTDCRTRLETYGLSVLACIPWMFCAPYAVTRDDLTLRLTLTEVATHRTCWRYELNASGEDSYSIYAGELIFRYDQLLHASMPAIVDSLRSAFQARPGEERSTVPVAGLQHPGGVERRPRSKLAHCLGREKGPSRASSDAIRPPEHGSMWRRSRGAALRCRTLPIAEPAPPS